MSWRRKAALTAGRTANLAMSLASANEAADEPARSSSTRTAASMISRLCACSY